MATESRIVGSGYTTFTYNGNPIAFAEIVADSGEELVNPTPDRLHPIHSLYPLEIVSCEATNGGQITLTIKETWDSEVWDQLPWTPDGAISIRELVNHPAVQLQKIIRRPDGSVRGKVYHGCRVTAVQTGETVNVGAVTIQKTCTITYTHCTKL